MMHTDIKTLITDMHLFSPLHQEMERVILATLRWDTAAVTPQDFLPHFLACVQERGDSEGELLSTLRRHSDTLAAMCACDSRFLGAPPSLVAAASLNCALRGLGNKGPTQLAVMGEALAELCQTDLVSTPGGLLMRVRGFHSHASVGKISDFLSVSHPRLCCSATVT